MHAMLRWGVGGKASFVRSANGVLAADRTPDNISTHTLHSTYCAGINTKLRLSP